MIQLSTGFQFISHHVIFGLAFLVLAYGLSIYRFKLIVNPVINYIGKVSYSMYLVHIAVLFWLNNYNLVDYWNNGTLNFLTRFLVVLLFTTLISTLTYNIIEVPFQKAGNKIINRWEKRKKG